MNNISGKTEFNIFKNYYTPEKRKRSSLVMTTLTYQSKDDVKSENLRGLVKEDFVQKKYNQCVKKYSECLRYATYGGRQFAMALANRSATFFYMKKYKNCLIDINLCLKTDFPNNLRPKLLIRKANCFLKMGNFEEMMRTIDVCDRQMQDLPSLPKIDKDNYIKKIESLLDIQVVEIEELSLDDYGFLPHDTVVEKHQQNPNMSASIKMKYNKNTGTDYVAARDIPRGEVLFVDEAYAGGCITKEHEELNSTELFICDFCYMEARNCIPCKICVNFMYCSENCRDEAWTAFHQWECDMFRSNLLAEELCLPYRTLIKAALSGGIFQIPNNTKPYKPTKNDNPYVQIYGLPADFATVRSKSADKLIKYCEQVVYMVEFLQKSGFFTVLNSTVSHQKDHSTLVNLVGGLLLRHIIHGQQRSLIMKYAATIALEDSSREELKIMFRTNDNFHAFCPAVSGLKYSCESNTSMYFIGTTCIVKACKNIKAGSTIFRTGFNLSPTVPFLIRTTLLQVLNINCGCTACEDVANNIDILDTFRCLECGNFTLVEHHPTSFMKCLDCKRSTDGETYKSKTRITRDQKKTIESLYKQWLNPYHKCFYVLYKELLVALKSKEEFNEALQNFKTCSEKRNGRFNAYEYLVDLAFICKTCLVHLGFHKSHLQINEMKEMLNYVLCVVDEAKGISEYTFPPFLRYLAQIEFLISRTLNED